MIETMKPPLQNKTEAGPVFSQRPRRAVIYYHILSEPTFSCKSGARVSCLSCPWVTYTATTHASHTSSFSSSSSSFYYGCSYSFPLPIHSALLILFLFHVFITPIPLLFYGPFIPSLAHPSTFIIVSLFMQYFVLLFLGSSVNIPFFIFSFSFIPASSSALCSFSSLIYIIIILRLLSLPHHSTSSYSSSSLL